jgi:hypothetical protein
VFVLLITCLRTLLLNNLLAICLFFQQPACSVFVSTNLLALCLLALLVRVPLHQQVTAVAWCSSCTAMKLDPGLVGGRRPACIGGLLLTPHPSAPPRGPFLILPAWWCTPAVVCPCNLRTSSPATALIMTSAAAQGSSPSSPWSRVQSWPTCRV